MVSILISVYSKENPVFLDQALQSICSQTICPNEVVLVKDGPLTEQLDAVISAYKSRLSFNIVKLDRNVGLALALNEGLKHVTNEWVLRFDSDDMCVENRLQKQIDEINLGRYDFFGGQIEEFDSASGNVMGRRIVPANKYSILKMFIYRNPFNHVTMCYRRDLVSSVGGYPNIPGFEDYALWAVLISKGYTFGNIPELLVRVRAGGLMLRRRGGISYLLNEYKLQKHIYNLGLVTSFQAILSFSIRSFSFMMPVYIKAQLYARFLRKSS